MSTARDHLKEDMDKRPEQLQREADEVRADMEHTVDDLVNQFSPGELINQAMSLFRGNGDSTFVRNLSNQVQNNPIPAILAGVSLTWLMSASKTAPAAKSGSGKSPTQSVRNASEKVSSATGSMAENAKEKQQHLAESAGDMKERLSDAGRHAMENTRSGATTVQNTYNDLLREQPLMIGALAIAAGAALGALLPRTQAEDSTIGEVSDEQKESMKRQAEDQAENLKEKAESKMEEKSGGQDSSSGSSGSKASTLDTGKKTSTGSESGRQDADSSTTSSRVTATPNSPAAGASGPPGSSPSAGSTSSTGSTPSAGSSKEGTPAATPSSVPGHPDTNPPELNRRDTNQR